MHDIFIVTNDAAQVAHITDLYTHAKLLSPSNNRLELFKQAAIQSVTEHAWVISGSCDYSDFDFVYQPPWHQNQQMHVWPTNNQCQGGNTVLLNVQEFLKQADTIDAAQNYKDICWKDQSLKETVQPEVFVWGQDNNTDIPGVQIMRYVGSHLDMMRKTIQKAKTPYIWVISDKLDYSDFDFSWRPDWAEEQYLHVWPTENQSLGGDTFYVNVDEFKHQQEIDSLELYQTIQWHKKSIAQRVEPEVFVWQNSNDSQFVEQNPCAIPLRSVGSKFDMMNRTVQKASTPYIWVVSDECDYNDFDFSWRPGWAEETFLHVWPTENQNKGGDTLYVNTVEFKKQSIEIEKLEQYDVIAWHKESVKQSNSNEVVIWDRGNREQVELLKQQHPDAVVLRYVGNHLEMMKKSVNKTSSNYIWVIGDNIDYSDFDFSWRPDWATETHLHVWPTENQTKGGDTFYVNTNEFKKQSIDLERLDYYDAVTWHKDSVKQLKKPDVVIWDRGDQTQMDVLKQQHPDAIVLRYVGNHLEMMKKSVGKTSSEYIWVISNNIDYNDFEFSWIPDWATESHLHVWPTGNQTKGGDTFYVNTTEFKKQSIDLERLDYYDAVTWHKESLEQIQTPDVVIWNQGNQSQVDALKQQHPNAVVLRYVGDHLEMMKKSVNKTSSNYIWIIGDNIDYSEFDFSWKPSWFEETHLHVWSTKDQVKSGDTFYVNTTEFKKQSIDLERLDYYDAVTWHKESVTQLQTPDVVIWDQGNQSQVDALKQQHPNAVVLRYVGDHLEMMRKSVGKIHTSSAWVISTGMDYSNFNFNWRPDWATETHLHVWTTENQTKGGDTFYVNTTEFKKQSIDLERLDYYDAVTWHKESVKQLKKPDVVIWDRGNQSQVDALKQQHPNAVVLRYVGDHLEMMKKSVGKVSTSNAWVIGDNIDYSEFDFDWRPDWATESHLHVWSTEDQGKSGDTFYVNTIEFKKQSIELERLDYYDAVTWHKDSVKQIISDNIIIWDRGDQSQVELLKQQHPNAVVLRYVGNHLEMMRKTVNKTSTSNVWVISTGLDYSNFNFNWRPDWATESHLHVWTTENQTKGGDTFYVNTTEFKKQSIELERLDYYDAVTWHKESITQLQTPDVVIWDQGNQEQVDALKQQHPNAIVLRYVGNHLEMMRKTTSKVSTPSAWVISSKCSYKDFNFNWRPDWATETHLHVWNTEDQAKGGDTFYVNTTEFKKQSIDLERLDYYDAVTWHKDQPIEQIQTPDVVIWDRGDQTQVDTLKKQHPCAIVLRYVGNHLEMMRKTTSKVSTPNAWVISTGMDYSNFNFKWRPDWATESHLHVWSTENQTKGGDTFYVNTVEFKKQSIELERLDYYDAVTWHKDRLIEQIYKPDVVIWNQGNQTQVDALKQQHPNAIVLRYVGNHLEMMRKTVQKTKTPYIWVINDELDYSDFDFGWRPDWATETHLHVWSTENQTKGGDTFYVNTTEFKKQSIELERLDYYDAVTWHKESITQLQTPDVVIWDRGNQSQVELLKQQHPNAVVLRYVGNHLEMMRKSVGKMHTSNAWVISDNIDYSNFDFNWRPSWATESHLHVWTTENQTKGGDTFYVNTTEFKKQSIELERLDYYDAVTWHKESITQLQTPDVVIWDQGNREQVELLKQQHPDAVVLRYVGNHLEMMKKSMGKVSTSNAWVISTGLDYSNFDFNWRPDWATESHLHVWSTKDQGKSGDTFYVNITEFKKQSIELERLDYYDAVTWHKDQPIEQIQTPDVVIWDRGDQTQVDVFKQQHPDAVVLRYVGNHLEMMRKTTSKVSTSNAWVISTGLDYSNFNFNWRPDWATESHLHVWPTENQAKGGDTFYVNTTEFKKQSIELERLDYYDAVTWHKDQPIEQIQTPDVVIWDRGNQEHVDTIKQQHPGAIVLRYVGNHLEMMRKTVNKTSTSSAWVISTGLDYSNFNFNWRPDWATESHLHVWNTEDQIKGGDTFYVNTVEFKKQSIDLERLDYYDAVTWHKESLVQLQTPDVVIWDRGNQEHVDTIKQQHPNAIVLRYVGNHLEMMRKSVGKVHTSSAWVISAGMDYSNFNFNWRPDWATESHLHVWNTEDQIKGGDTFYVNTVEFKKQSIELERLDYYDAVTWHKESLVQLQTPDVVIWDNGSNDGNLEYLKIQYPNAKVLRNIGNRFEMMKRTMRHVESSYAWVINSKCSYTDFNFNWRPDWATESHLHVWPTENQTKGGDTFYVNTTEFKKQSIEIENIEYYDAVTWHKESVNLASEVDVIVWSFGGNQENLSRIKEQYPAAKTLRYIGTHLEMLKKSAKYTDSENFWVLSDCCDYSEFNQNWKPDWETENSIHCWASGSQEFGDTFYIPKTAFLVEANDIEKLEYYSSIVWHHNGYPRLPWPINDVKNGDIYSAITAHQFQSIYEYFVAPGSTLGSTVDPSLWEKRHLIAYNNNGHVSLCPRDAIGNISDRLSSYPYIQYHKCENSTQKLQDIVFISYDEKDADLNYSLLLERFPTAKRVHGIKGNVRAYKEAAKLSSTPWYYAVFPKTKIDPNFGFDHHPNYLETPGHYIFNAHNVITDYAYGHGGVKMYHVKTTIEIEKWGYDFTLSSPVTVIPVNSCYLVPASPYEAWRTSFREVLKLKDNKTLEGKYRLNRWLTGNYAEFGEYSMQGAADALEYNGEVELANSWEWLRDRFNSRYN